MASEMLLINPRGRSRRKASGTKRRRTHARRRNPSTTRVRYVTRSRRRNPIRSIRSRVPGVRRRNPIRSRRRRNPIGGGLGSMNSWIGMFKDAAVGGAGAIAMDLVMGQINPHLPTNLQTNDTSLGAGDAVKALITVLLGKFLSRPTRGLSMKMATGALTVQAAEAMRGFVPASMPIAGMGYANPAKVVNMNARRGAGGMSQFTNSQALLSRFTPGSPQFVNGARSHAGAFVR